MAWQWVDSGESSQLQWVPDEPAPVALPTTGPTTYDIGTGLRMGDYGLPSQWFTAADPSMQPGLMQTSAENDTWSPFNSPMHTPYADYAALGYNGDVLITPNMLSPASDANDAVYDGTFGRTTPEFQQWLAGKGYEPVYSRSANEEFNALLDTNTGKLVNGTINHDNNNDAALLRQFVINSALMYAGANSGAIGSEAYGLTGAAATAAGGATVGATGAAVNGGDGKDIARGAVIGGIGGYLGGSMGGGEVSGMDLAADGGANALWQTGSTGYSGIDMAADVPATGNQLDFSQGYTDGGTAGGAADSYASGPKDFRPSMGFGSEGLNGAQTTAYDDIINNTGSTTLAQAASDAAAADPYSSSSNYGADTFTNTQQPIDYTNTGSNTAQTDAEKAWNSLKEWKGDIQSWVKENPILSRGLGAAIGGAIAYGGNKQPSTPAPAPAGPPIQWGQQGSAPAAPVNPGIPSMPGTSSGLQMGAPWQPNINNPAAVTPRAQWGAGRYLGGT